MLVEERQPLERIVFHPDEDGRRRASDQFAPFSLKALDTKAPKPARIIPTGSREQLGKGLSYPVGGETISRALVGLPQFERASADFTCFDRWSEASNEPIQV